jgi:hypothetical protein
MMTEFLISSFVPPGVRLVVTSYSHYDTGGASRRYHPVSLRYHSDVTAKRSDAHVMLSVLGEQCVCGSRREEKSPMFRMRDFAGYIGFPIPHPQDARVLAALNDGRKRDQMSPDDVGILAIFCHRKAVEAVRTSNVATFREGILGIAVASELNGDYREVCMGLATLFYCARLLHVTDQEIIEWAVTSGFSEKAVDTLQAFSRRTERDRALSSFGMHAFGQGRDFNVR